MHDPDLLRQLLVFLLAPVVVVPIFRWLRSSQILGYLAAGVLSWTARARMDREQRAHTGARRARHRLPVLRDRPGAVARSAARDASPGVRARRPPGNCDRRRDRPGGAALGAQPAAAFVIGGGLALSSTAFVLQLMVERGEQVTRFGRTAFAILLFQDLAVVPLLAIVSVLGQTHPAPWVALAWAGLEAVVALALIIAIGRLLVRPVFRMVAATRSPELFISATLLVVLGTGWLTAQGGLTLPLGAFLAGLLLSETEYRHQVEADIRPFRGLLVGLFFLTVGLVGRSRSGRHQLAARARAARRVAGRQGGDPCALVPAVSRDARGRAAHRAAASAGRRVRVRPVRRGVGPRHSRAGHRAGLVATVALSMAVTPFLAALGAPSGSGSHRGATDLAALQAEARPHADHVVIAGFGRVGQTVAKVLGAAGIPYVALDLDHARVARCRARGLPAFYGDASRVDVLSAAGAGRARAAVLTMDHPASIDHAVAALHQHFPELRIFVRGRDPPRPSSGAVGRDRGGPGSGRGQPAARRHRAERGRRQRRGCGPDHRAVPARRLRRPGNDHRRAELGMATGARCVHSNRRRSSSFGGAGRGRSARRDRALRCTGGPGGRGVRSMRVVLMPQSGEPVAR